MNEQLRRFMSNLKADRGEAVAEEGPRVTTEAARDALGLNGVRPPSQRRAPEKQLRIGSMTVSIGEKRYLLRFPVSNKPKNGTVVNFGDVYRKYVGGGWMPLSEKEARGINKDSVLVATLISNE